MKRTKKTAAKKTAAKKATTAAPSKSFGLDSSIDVAVGPTLLISGKVVLRTKKSITVRGNAKSGGETPYISLPCSALKEQDGLYILDEWFAPRGKQAKIMEEMAEVTEEDLF